ncbi:MAG: glycosyltransferase family 2 protein [Chloroflexota bacterium]
MTAPGASVPRVLALIPGYEEGPRIGRVVEQTRRYLPVLVVDDGSTDDTAAQAEAAGATVLPQRPNQGKGAALRMGFRRALSEGYDAVVTLDADGQHAPDEIPRFIEALSARPEHPELVIGQRDFSRMPPIRRLSNTIGGAAFSWAVGQRIPDNQSGYRLLGRQLMAAMTESRETGFEFEVEMIAVCIRRGWSLAWVPISTIYAGEPSHVKPIHHLRHFVRATRAARRLIREP